MHLKNGVRGGPARDPVPVGDETTRRRVITAAVGLQDLPHLAGRVPRQDVDTWLAGSPLLEIVFDHHPGANGTPVIIYDCTGGANQKWTVTSSGAVLGTGSGKCLDATGHGTANGTTIQLWSCTGTANQTWRRSQCRARNTMRCVCPQELCAAAKDGSVLERDS